MVALASLGKHLNQETGICNLEVQPTPPLYFPLRSMRVDETKATPDDAMCAIERCATHARMLPTQQNETNNKTQKVTGGNYPLQLLGSPSFNHACSSHIRSRRRTNRLASYLHKTPTRLDSTRLRCSQVQFTLPSRPHDPAILPWPSSWAPLPPPPPLAAFLPLSRPWQP